MVYLRAFLDENLGDDLFVQIIAQRYPKKIFQVFESDEYPVKFGENVRFAFSKNEYRKFQDKIGRYNEWRSNKIRRKLLPLFFRPDYREQRKLANNSKTNIYVIGSGFMEGGKTGFWRRLEDKLYYSNKPYILGCNFGPFFSDEFRERYKKLFGEAKDVCFRESYSYEIFKDLGNVRWESDIVFSYNGYVDESFFQYNKNYIVISVVNLEKDGIKNSNKDLYYSYISKIAESFLRKKKKVVFVGFCRKQGDHIAIEQIVNIISSEFSDMIEIINYPEKDIPYILGVFKNAEAIFASRYHAGIIGMLYEKKTYFLSYSNKTKNVLNDIDREIRCIDINKEINVAPEDFISQYGYCISKERLKSLKESANRQFLKLDLILK